MRRSLSFRLLAVFLCAVLCFHQLDGAAYSEPQEKPPTEQPGAYSGEAVNSDEPLIPPLQGDPADPAWGEPLVRSPLEICDESIIDELSNKREEGAKHFQLSDGSRAAVVYGFPVHEEDAAGEWIEIDNTLSPVKNTAGRYDYVQESISRQTTFFGNPESGRLLRLERPGRRPPISIGSPADRRSRISLIRTGISLITAMTAVPEGCSA